MPLPWRIDWHALYGSAVDVAWLSAIIIRHADILSHAAATLLASDTAASQRDVVFVDVPSERPHGGSAALDDGEDVPDDAPFPLHLASAARCIYGVPRLRPRQVKAVSRLVLDESSQGRLLLVDRTGAGKLLVLFFSRWRPWVG